jgi:hypothetical protein
MKYKVGNKMIEGKKADSLNLVKKILKKMGWTDIKVRNTFFLHFHPLPGATGFEPLNQGILKEEVSLYH